MGDSEIDAVLSFWFETSGPEDWFKKDDNFDAEIHKRFAGLHEDIMNDTREHWRETAKGCLAEIIVLDQFSRNMFRNDPKSFASDARARDCLAYMIRRGFDQGLTQNERNFAYLPLQHSEDITDQEKSIDLYSQNKDEDTLDYAHRHKVIIERFGRFPHRNKVLGRVSTTEELEFLEQPGSSF